MRLLWRSAVVTAVFVPLVVSWALPANANLTGGCSATGTHQTTGKTYDAQKTNFAKLPRTGDVKWEGAVPVPPAARLAVGEVQIKFPWPVGNVEIGSWGKNGKTTSANSNSGTYRYDFPKAIAGIKVLVHGRDKEPNGVLCKGSVVVQIEGTSPLAWVSLALTFFMVMNLSLTIRARKVLR